MARRESDWDDVAPATGAGFAQGASGDGPPALDEFAAILWVPDPEQRHGWREFWVRKPDTKPAGRPMGFGRPGER